MSNTDREEHRAALAEIEASEARRKAASEKAELDRELAAALLRMYRAAHPESRATSLLRLSRNGPSIKRQQCVLCGVEGPSWCALYPKTQRAQTWAAEHVQTHLDDAAAEGPAATKIRFGL